jgi:hypothetical protein
VNVKKYVYKLKLVVISKSWSLYYYWWPFLASENKPIIFSRAKETLPKIRKILFLWYFLTLFFVAFFDLIFGSIF